MESASHAALKIAQTESRESAWESAPPPKGLNEAIAASVFRSEPRSTAHGHLLCQEREAKVSLIRMLTEVENLLSTSGCSPNFTSHPISLSLDFSLCLSLLLSVFFFSLSPSTPYQFFLVSYTLSIFAKDTSLSELCSKICLFFFLSPVLIEHHAGCFSVGPGCQRNSDSACLSECNMKVRLITGSSKALRDATAIDPSLIKQPRLSARSVSFWRLEWECCLRTLSLMLVRGTS